MILLNDELHDYQVWGGKKWDTDLKGKKNTSNLRTAKD